MSDSVRPVARFRAGEVVNGEPRMCDAWRVTTDDRAVATAVAEAFGGEVLAINGSYEVRTTATEVEGTLVSVSREFTKWDSGVLMSRCDGAVKADGGGACCTAGMGLDDRMTVLRAMDKTPLGGCKPSTRVVFTVPALEAFGPVELRSGGKGVFAGTEDLVDAAGTRVTVAIREFDGARGQAYKAPVVERGVVQPLEPATIAPPTPKMPAVVDDFESPF